VSAGDPIAAFKTEADELLQQIEQDLLDLGGNLQDADLVNAVFRGLHTLKGSGAMFGFDKLAGFTHHCETAFDNVRKGRVPATAGLVEVILSAKDHMSALVHASEADHDTASAEILSRLKAAVDAASGAPADTPAPLPAKAGWRVKFYLPPDAMANGTNPLALVDELRELGQAQVALLTDRLPALDDLVPTECHFGWDVTVVTDAPRSAVEDVFIFVIDDMEIEISPLADAGSDEVAAADDVMTPEAAIGGAPTENPPAAVTAIGPAAKTKSVENVRVPAERLDELMDRVGELVIAQSRLFQLAQNSIDMSLRSVSEEIGLLASELRDTMMVLRMVPVSNLFGRFRRLIHDLARDTGKAIELTTEGENVELDKTVIERLADPMIHLIRNSCDHGIEAAGGRAEAGKPEMGRIHLGAHQAGGEVIITIEDDGKGMDRDRIRAKAEAQGLLQPGQAITDADLLQLIFHPGFSTAAQVTSLSGRGVGMDVVKRTIESLRGTIDLESTPGKGSTIKLRIPLTLAIIEGLLVRVGAGRYVLPLATVEECIELSQADDIRSRGSSFITLRDRLVPYIRLRELFATSSEGETYQKIVVVGIGAEKVGLVVDQIIGNHQTVIKSMSPLHRNVTTFAGATILGDGEVALILDVAHLVALGQEQEERLRAAG
jgi:two-component system chemotaxis sensor kinase CheA